jgi:hypothetical protein
VVPTQRNNQEKSGHGLSFTMLLRKCGDADGDNQGGTTGLAQYSVRKQL